MSYKTVVLGIFIILFVTVQFYSAESEQQANELYAELAAELEARHVPRGWPMVILAGATMGVSGASAIIFSCIGIASSITYLSGIYPMMELTFASVSIFSVSLSALLTATASAYFWSSPLVTMTLGIISGQLAMGALVPAAVLTHQYVARQVRGRWIETALLWTWSTFGLFIIPAITAAILGIFYRGVVFESHKRQGIALLLTGDRIGIVVRL